MPAKRLGFTLVELLVVIAIIVILASLLFPVFVSARERARGAMCISNCRQMATALMGYVQDNDEGLPAMDTYSACLSINAKNGTTIACGTPSPDRFWDAVLLPYVRSGNPGAADRGGVWHCPSSTAPTTVRTYGYSQVLSKEGWGDPPVGSTSGRFDRFLREPEIDMPVQTVIFGDTGSSGSLGAPWLFSTFRQRGGNLSRSPAPGTDANTNLEWPDRHAGSATYVFCDGHARQIRDGIIYPPGMQRARLAGDDVATFRSGAEFFAVTAAERGWCRSRIP